MAVFGRFWEWMHRIEIVFENVWVTLVTGTASRGSDSGTAAVDTRASDTRAQFGPESKQQIGEIGLHNH